MVWYTIGQEDKKIRYHARDENGDSEYVDEFTIEEGKKEINIKYKIQPSQECDILEVKTSDVYIKVCYNNSKEHEDPFFTFKDVFENADAEELINDIKKYILDVVAYSLQSEN